MQLERQTENPAGLSQFPLLYLLYSLLLNQPLPATRETDRNSSAGLSQLPPLYLLCSLLLNQPPDRQTETPAGLSQFPLLYLLCSLLLNQPPERQTETPALDLVSFLHFTCCARFSSTRHTFALRLHLHASGRERQRAREVGALDFVASVSERRLRKQRYNRERDKSRERVCVRGIP